MFPKIDNEGFIYLTKEGLRGREAAKNKSILVGRELEDHLRSHFPARPLYQLENPEGRALRKKGQGQWTADTIRAARDAFYLPAATSILIIWPDLYDRDVLKEYSEF